jgi:predicted N-acetyltransferase YhbS
MQADHQATAFPGPVATPLPEEDLGDGLVIRTLRTEDEIAQYCQIQAEAFSPSTGTSTENLIRHHPETCRADFIFVEDQKNNRMASTLCLIPWQCQFEGISLSVAMLEMVATRPEYRRLGLVRQQMAYYHRWVDRRGFELCIIEGIPNYYRQYDYTYAVDHRCYDRLPRTKVSSTDTGSPNIVIEPGTINDIPDLIAGYQKAMMEIEFHAARNADYWEYLLQKAQYPVQVLKDSDSGAFLGYFVPVAVGEDALRVIDYYLQDQPSARAVLQWLAGQGKVALQLGWPEDSPLVAAGRQMESEKTPGYQWLFRVPDFSALLMKLAAVFEKRLATSGLGALTRSVRINLFRCTYQMEFVDGGLEKVQNLGFVDSSIGCDGGDLCIPRDAFVRLLLGYRRLESLYDAWPDIVLKPESLALINTLFPRIQSHLRLPYGYWGPPQQS